jgi:acylphosphatase
MAEARLRLLISGRVQGVGFRAFVAREARAAGLSGFVRNLVDGGVEAEFEGAAAKVDAVRRACERGPAGARVAHVEVLAPSAQTFDGAFDVLRDASLR